MANWKVIYDQEYEFGDDEAGARAKYNESKIAIDIAGKGSVSIHNCLHAEGESCLKAGVERYEKNIE